MRAALGICMSGLMVTAGCTTTENNLRHLALGDSYTIGEGVPETARWPNQLAAQLRADGISIGEPTLIAHTGWTIAELDIAMDAAALDPPYDLVTLLIGVNDQYRGGEPEEFRTSLRALLARAITLAGARPERVLLVSTPDWGVAAFAEHDARGASAIGQAIDAFNEVARDESRRAGAGFVDITAVSREPRHRAQLVADGLHPDGEQYRAWTLRIAPAARAALVRE